MTSYAWSLGPLGCRRAATSSCSIAAALIFSSFAIDGGIVWCTVCGCEHLEDLRIVRNAELLAQLRSDNHSRALS